MKYIMKLIDSIFKRVKKSQQPEPIFTEPLEEEQEEGPKGVTIVVNGQEMEAVESIEIRGSQIGIFAITFEEEEGD